MDQLRVRQLEERQAMERRPGRAMTELAVKNANERRGIRTPESGRIYEIGGRNTSQQMLEERRRAQS
jgi:hypothetical protein